MLQAASYAIWLADQGTVPDTAPADFQAGLMNGFNGATVWTKLRECWIPDQHMADSCDSFIASVEKKDWKTVEATIKEFVPEVEVDIKPCLDQNKPEYKPVADQYYLQQHTVMAARNDPDWQIKILKATLHSKKDIKAYMADAEAKWDAGDYFNSGVAIGKIEAIALAPWPQPSTATEPIEAQFLQW